MEINPVAMTLDAQIEAILFWKAEPIAKKELAKILKCSISDIEKAITTLEGKLKGRGLTLISKDDAVTVATASEFAPTLEILLKEELSKDLGRAGLETLTIILYRGPIARRDIDYIRGVNSNFILRNLMIRGLVERVQDETDQRSFLYKPTFELLSYLGLSKIDELPEYAEVQKEIENFKKSDKESLDVTV